MTAEHEIDLSPERELVDLTLDWFDLRAGHWPDLKSPPWGLNDFGSIKKKWPDVNETLSKADKEMKPGEERDFWSGEIKFPDGRIEAVDVKIRCIGHSHGGSEVSLWLWPKDQKYY